MHHEVNTLFKLKDSEFVIKVADVNFVDEEYTISDENGDQTLVIPDVFILLEKIDGVYLQDILVEKFKVSDWIFEQIFIQLMIGIKNLNAKGFVH